MGNWSSRCCASSSNDRGSWSCPSRLSVATNPHIQHSTCTFDIWNRINESILDYKNERNKSLQSLRTPAWISVTLIPFRFCLSKCYKCYKCTTVYIGVNMDIISSHLRVNKNRLDEKNSTLLLAYFSFLGEGNLQFCKCSHVTAYIAIYIRIMFFHSSQASILIMAVKIDWYSKVNLWVLYVFNFMRYHQLDGNFREHIAFRIKGMMYHKYHFKLIWYTRSMFWQVDLFHTICNHLSNLRITFSHLILITLILFFSIISKTIFYFLWSKLFHK